jgi:ArsR family transcriptional regulator
MDMKSAVPALAALAQASRLAVFRHLVALAPDGAHPGDIAEALAIPANTLSFHLKTLAHAGLVTSEQTGRHIRYRADTGAMQELVGFLSDTCCGGDPTRCAPRTSSTARKKASP